MTRLIRPEGVVDVNETLVNFVLDETGSMHSCLAATISGFNEYVQTLKSGSKVDTPIRMSLTTFNSEKIKTIFTNKIVSEVPILDEHNYVPNALTPLYDAIGHAVKFVEVELLSKKRKRKMPKIVCVILTDGLENSSSSFTKDQIAELIKEKEKSGWTFVYLGANQDAWQVGISMGVSKGNVAGYTANNTGYGMAFKALGQDTLSYHVGDGLTANGITKSFARSVYDVGDKIDNAMAAAKRLPKILKKESLKKRSLK
jgi:hypothetical protein